MNNKMNKKKNITTKQDQNDLTKNYFFLNVYKNKKLSHAHLNLASLNHSAF